MNNDLFKEKMEELQEKNKKIQKAFIKTLSLFTFMILINIIGLYVSNESIIHNILIAIMPIYTFFGTYTITRCFQDLH